MAISRSQMQRQLYEGGGITSLKKAKDVLESQALPGEFLAYINPQEAAMLKYMGGAGIPINSSGVPSFFVKSISKAFKSAAKGVTGAVKGAVGTVKDIASSDVGKAALLAAGAYYAPAMFGGTVGFGPGTTYGSFARGLMSPNFIGPMTKAGSLGRTISSGIAGALTGKNILKTAGIGAGILGGAALATEVFGSPQAAQEAYQRDPEMVKMYLKQYYRNINPDASDQEVEQFASSQLAEYGAKQDLADGGRVGFEEGGTFLTMEEAAERDPAMFMDTTTYNPIPADANRQSAAEIARIMMGISDLPREEDEMEDDTMGSTEFVYNEYLIPKRRELMENFGLSLEEADELIKEEMTKLRTKKADGGMPTGIMRTNQAGIMERDYRQEGGFVPVGIKEKADDVPAMLSKNEFVFTADAVRGAGEGDVEKGAERLYNTMKTLENGGRV